MPRSRSYHLHLPHFTFDNSKNLKLLYAIRVIRDLVNKMALFFLPIFLFNIGSKTTFLSFLTNFFEISLTGFQKGMLVISLYYTVYGLVGLLLGIPTGKALGKIGYQRSFVISFMLRTLVFLFLYLSKANPLYLFPSMILDGVNSQFFWGGYYSILSKFVYKKNMGKDLGLLQFLLQAIAVVSPAVSGAIAYIVGLEYLFLISMMLTLLSSVLALMMDTKIQKNSVSLKGFISWVKEKRFIKLGLAYSGRYINDSGIFLWSLYIYFLLGSVDKVGYLYTLSLFLAMFFTFFTGKYIDQHKSKKPFYLSGSFISILWLLRTRIFSVWSIAIVDTFDKLASNVYSLYFNSIFMNRGKGHLSDEYFTYSELMLSATRVVLWPLFGLFFIFFSSWNSIFIVAGVGALTGLLMTNKKSKYGQ